MLEMISSEEKLKERKDNYILKHIELSTVTILALKTARVNRSLKCGSIKGGKTINFFKFCKNNE